jgi:hypothetical protein
LGYDHDGQRELPLREDVDRFIQSRLCQWGPSALLQAGGDIAPAVSLLENGTVIIAFYTPRRALTFWVKGDNLVIYRQDDHRDKTKVEGRLPARYTDAIALCTELVAWLHGHQPCAKS